MSTVPLITGGRIILSVLAISNSISPFIADYNETHVFNPNWPPHARFHNGQTMSMGAALGLLTMYFTWRPALSSTLYSKLMQRDSIFTAAVIASLYWVTGIGGGFYPGAKYMDPEFIGSKYDVKMFGLPVQAPIFAAHAILAWIGYGLEVTRLSKAKGD